MITSGSGRGGLLEVGIALVLQDRFSQPAREASGEIRKLHQQAKLAVNANLQAAYSIGNGLYQAGMRAAASLTATVLEGAQFIDTMTTVGAITQATTEQMDTLTETAQTIGLKTMFSSQEIASGMKYLAMAGNSASEINDVIMSAANVAGATGMALGGKGGAADMITNVMKSFRYEGEAAAETVGNQLTKATLSANISMMDLAQSIKYSAADMVSLGRELPEVAAMIGTLGNAGIQGSMAGVAISNMARYLNKALSDPNYKGHKRLKQLGIDLADVTNANGDLTSFHDILTQIKAATADMGSVELNRVLTDIFGVRGFRGAFALMNDLEGLDDLTKSILHSEGYAEEIRDKRMKSLAGSIDIMRSAWENLRTTFVKKIEPTLSVVFRTIGGMLEALRDFINTPFGAIIGNLTVLATTISTLLGGFLMIRSKWLIFKNDTLITSKSLFTTLTSTWRGASMEASQYLNILRQIAMTQSGLGTGIPPNLTTFRTLGMVQKADNGSKYVEFSQQRRDKRGRFAKGYEWSYALGESGELMNSRGRVLKGKEYQRAVDRINAKYGAGTLQGLSSAGTSGFGAMGGWVNIGSSLLKMVGPLVAIAGIQITSAAIQAKIARNQEEQVAALKKNTASALTLAGKYDKEAERLAAKKYLNIEQEVRLLRNVMEEWARRTQHNVQGGVYIMDERGQLRKASVRPATALGTK